MQLILYYQKKHSQNFFVCDNMQLLNTPGDLAQRESCDEGFDCSWIKSSPIGFIMTHNRAIHSN